MRVGSVYHRSVVACDKNGNVSSNSVARWPWQPLNNSKQAVKK
jgi:hypothetical protein